MWRQTAEGLADCITEQTARLLESVERFLASPGPPWKNLPGAVWWEVAGVGREGPEVAPRAARMPARRPLQ